MLIPNNQRRGQGLLEVIIGVGVILAGTLGTITLVTKTIQAGRSTNNQIVAANLAREGIEIARSNRDSNWLKIQANEDVDTVTAGTQLATTFKGLFDSTNHVGVPVFDWRFNAYTMSGIPVGSNFDTDCPTAGPDHDCSQVYRGVNGFYQQVVAGPASPPTVFKRLMYLHPICRADGPPPDGNPDFGGVEEIVSTDGQTCADLPDEDVMVGLQVLSRVEWTENTTLKSIELEDRLYNWKYAR